MSTKKLETSMNTDKHPLVNQYANGHLRWAPLAFISIAGQRGMRGIFQEVV